MIRANQRIITGAALLRDAAPAVSWPAVGGVLGLFFVLTCSLALYLNLGQDEAYSFHTSATDVVSALGRGISYEAQAPLYFGILALWHGINDSVFFARLLSIAFSCITLAFAWLFARRYIRGIAPEIVLAFVAFNPFTIWAAVEIRPYPAAIALSTALLYYFFRGWVSDDADLRPRAAFVATAILSAYTQYYIVTLVAAGAVTIVALGQIRKLPSYLAASSIVAVALLPLVWIIPLQLKAYEALSAASPLPAFAIVLALFEFVLPHHSIGSWAHQPKENALYFLCALALGAVLWTRLKKLSRVSRALTAMTVCLAALFAFIVEVVSIHIALPRQSAVLFAPTLLGVLSLIGDVSARRRGGVLGSYAAVYALLVGMSLWADYRDMSKAGDWERVGNLLSAKAAGSDTVALFDAEIELPLQHYFPSRAFAPIPRPLSFDRFDARMFVIQDERQVADILGPRSAHHQRVWLVMNDVCTTLPKFYGCAHLSGYVDRHFRIVKTYEFNRSSVTELVAKR